LPIEVVDAAPEATLDAINAEADREARLAARRFEREGEALAVEVVADRPAGIPDHDSTNSSGVPVRAIVSTSMDTPLSPHERASIARLLEATVEALGNERATHAMNAQAFTTHLRWIADRAALAVRQGHRAHLLDQLTADLDTFIASLSQP
jgi:hypothetical protein